MKKKVNVDGKEVLYKDAIKNHLLNRGYSEYEANWQADQMIKKMHIE